MILIAWIRATVFEAPEVQTSWGPHTVDAWYVGPSWDHYRCMYFQIPATGGYRTSGQYNLYPTHVDIPKKTSMDRAV